MRVLRVLLWFVLVSVNFNLSAQEIKHLKIRKSKEKIPSFNQLFFSKDIENPQKLTVNEWVDKVFENLYVYTSNNLPLRLGTNYYENQTIAKSILTYTNGVSLTENMGQNRDFELMVRPEKKDTFLFKQIKLQCLIIPLLYQLNETEDEFKILEYAPYLYLKNGLKLSIPRKMLLSSLQKNDFELFLIEIDDNTFYEIEEIGIIQKRNKSIINQKRYQKNYFSFQDFKMKKGDIFMINAIKINRVDTSRNILQSNIKTENNSLAFEVI